MARIMTDSRLKRGVCVCLLWRDCGVFLACLWHVCVTLRLFVVACFWRVSGVFLACFWRVSGVFLARMWHTVFVCGGVFVGCLWRVCSMFVTQVYTNTHKNTETRSHTCNNTQRHTDVDRF